jgi:hypothetical protein
LAQRKACSLPPFRRIVVAMLIFLVFYVALCFLVGPANEKEYHFAREEGAITALSAIFLAMGAAFAGSSRFLSQQKGGLKSSFWLIMTCVFGFLAIDELMKIHEGLGWLTQQQFNVPRGFRNWNDIIVISYGLLALVGAFIFLPVVLRYPRFLEVVGIAFAFFVVHTLIDSLSEPKTALSMICEESAKLFCVAFLALAMFIALIGITSQKTKG